MITTSQFLQDIAGTDDLSPVTSSWYVIHTKPRQEERAQANLTACSIETFYPRVKDHRRNEFTGVPITFVRPLFPQYLFAKVVSNRLINKICFARGVDRLVSFGDGPCAIDEEIIQILQAQVREDGFVRIGEDLKPGDKVVIRSGPLKNLIGIFERDLTDHQRVMILLTAIGYQGHLEVDRGLVRKVA